MTVTRVLIAVAAQSRGFRNPLAFRRWARSHGVELLRDGRRLWVAPADIDAALERVAAVHVPSTDARVLSIVRVQRGALAEHHATGLATGCSQTIRGDVVALEALERWDVDEG